MDKNKKNLAKITFSDGKYCYAKTNEFGVKIDSTIKIFNKEHKITKKNINWDNEEIIIDYINDSDLKTYKGKIDNNGKPIGKGELIYKDDDVYEGYFMHGEPNGIGTFTSTIDNYIYVGDFVDGIPNGEGKITYEDGDVYVGFLKDGEPNGLGRFTKVNEETREPLYTEIYNENGIMENVEYLFEDQGNRYRMTINYDGINRALNRGEINETEDLRSYITVFDEHGNEIRNYDIIQLVKQCAKYQMQAKLKGKSDILDDKNKMNGGDVGLENLITLAEVIDNINALKRTRFGIKQNNPGWPTSVYNNMELFLNSLGLTMNSTSDDNILSTLASKFLNYLGLRENDENNKSNNQIKDNTLIPIDRLLEDSENRIDFFSINMTTTANNHAVSAIIDLDKLKQNRKNFIYVYDSSRAISADPDGTGDLGGLQKDCQFYSHAQQDLGSCWYNACCATIVAAAYYQIIEGIRNGRIEPIEKEKIFADNTTEFNDFEVLQMIAIQKVADDLDTERLGEDYKKMIHQVVNEYTRKQFERWADRYTERYTFLEDLGLKLGMYIASEIVADERGLFNKYDIKMEKIDKKLKKANFEDLEQVDDELIGRFRKTNNIGEESLKKIRGELKLLPPTVNMEILKKMDRKAKKPQDELPQLPLLG